MIGAFAKRQEGCETNILWEPDALDAPFDRQRTSRFVLDTIRYRADVRDRFRERLTGGSGGPFALWLRESAERWKIPRLDRSVFDAIIDEGLSSAALIALQIYAGDTGQPCEALLPGRRRTLVRILFDTVAIGKLSREAAWWLLIELEEAPQRGTVWGWLINPDWQRKHPIGIATSGRQAFADWLLEEHGVPASLCDTATWPQALSPVDEARLTWLGSPGLQAAFPDATRDPGDAAALARELAPEDGPDADALASELLRPGLRPPSATSPIPRASGHRCCRSPTRREPRESHAGPERSGGDHAGRRDAVPGPISASSSSTSP